MREFVVRLPEGRDEASSLQGGGRNRRAGVLAAVGMMVLAGISACGPDDGLRQAAGGSGGTAWGTGGAGATGGLGEIPGTGGEGGAGAGGGGGTTGTGGTLGGPPPKPEPIPLSPEQAWLNDRNIWKPLPEEMSQHCRAHYADRRDLRFPELEWVSCGEGCAKADLVQGLGWHASTVSLTTILDENGEAPLLRFVVSGLGGHDVLYAFHRLLRLDTGENLTAVRFKKSRGREYSPCSPTTVDHAPRLLWGLGDSSRDVDGAFDITRERWTWNLPWFDTNEVLPSKGLECTSVPMEDGRTIFPCIAKVYAQITPGSSDVSVLDDITPYRMGVFGSSLGGLAVWPELEAPEYTSRIRGWSSDAGIHTVVPSIPGDTCFVALSDTHMAGISFDWHGMRDCWMAMKNPRFWVAPRDSESTVGELVHSPVLDDEMAYSVLRLATWGPRIAAIISESGFVHNRKRWIVVSSFPDWRQRWMEIPAMIYPHRVSLTSTHLYVVLGPVGADIGKVYEVYRYDLADLDAFTTER